MRRQCNPVLSKCEIRELLLISYDSDIISDDKFCLLYDNFTSKNPDFPYDSYDRFDLQNIDESECISEFRTRKEDITMLAVALRLPANIHCPNRTICERTEALCMLLRRFAYPCRYYDMINRFGRPVPELCLITNTILDYTYDNHNHRISQWNHIIMSPHLLQEYADAIHRKGAPLNNYFGFVRDCQANMST